MGFSRQEYWSELPLSYPGDLPDPGIKPDSLTSPALTGKFFTYWATWKAQGTASLFKLGPSENETNALLTALRRWNSYTFNYILNYRSKDKFTAFKLSGTKVYKVKYKISYSCSEIPLIRGSYSKWHSIKMFKQIIWPELLKTSFLLIFPCCLHRAP